MKYQMHEQMFAIGEDYWIETDGGRPAFKVDGKVLRIRKTLILEAPEGRGVHHPEEAAEVEAQKLSAAMSQRGISIRCRASMPAPTAG